jgi:hypothetical protein
MWAWMRGCKCKRRKGWFLYIGWKTRSLMKGKNRVDDGALWRISDLKSRLFHAEKETN